METAEKARALRLLTELLSIPSVNGRDDEGAVARWLCRTFQSAGLSAFVQEIDGTHANVVAVLKGIDNSDPAVWNGHLDTVPYGDESAWHTDPAVPTERDGLLYARGASDMKSGLAAMAYALCAYAASGRRPARRTVFLGTCDEERGGLGASAILRDNLLPPCSTLLIGEPTGNQFGVAQKGCIWLQIHVAGKTSHGAYPEQGCNAVERGFELAAALKKEVGTYRHPVLGGATAQITRIEGGVAPNMTPDQCTLLMDIRTVPGLTEEMILNFAASFAKKSVLQYNETVLKFGWKILNCREAIEIRPDHPLLLRLREAVNRRCGGGRPIGINFFTDASILVRDRPETAVLLFGPGEPELAHRPNESVGLERYYQAIDVFLDLLA